MIASRTFSAAASLAWLCFLSSSLAAEELPRYLEPNDATGASGAVVVGEGPLVHTAQILPHGEGGPVAADAAGQMQAVLDRLDAVLKKAQSGLEHVVKLNIYLARQEASADVQRVLAARFRGPRKPAVSLVVTPLPEPKALVAADAVATTTTDAADAVQAIGGQGSPTSHEATAMVCPPGPRIYVAGQAETSNSLAEATRKTLESLRATLRFLNRSDANVVQLKAFVSPMADAAIVQRETAAFFGDRAAPPLVLVEWKSSPTTPIEIELIAWGGPKRNDASVEYLTPPGMKASPIYSRVARINHPHTIYISGLYATSAAEGADPNTPAAGEREVKQVFTQLDQLLKQAGSDFRHLAKATYYVATDAASTKLNELRPNYYDPQRPPAASKAAVSGVGRGGLGLTIDMIAVPAPNDETRQ